MRLILCEGKHAISALQGLLESAFDCKTQHDRPSPDWYAPPRRSGQTLRQLSSPSNQEIFIHGLGGKDPLWKALRLLLGPGRLPKADTVAICFDPDSQSEADWRKAVEDRISEQNANWERSDRSYRISYENATVALLPFPWISPREEVKVGFPIVESLYRVVVDSLSMVYPDRAERVEQWTDAVRRNGAQTNWKAQCWFWMAGWFAQAACDRFFGEVMRSQAIHRVLMDSSRTKAIWEVLETIGA